MLSCDELPDDHRCRDEAATETTPDLRAATQLDVDVSLEIGWWNTFMGDTEVGLELERTAATDVGARRCADPVHAGTTFGHAGNSLGDFR